MTTLCSVSGGKRLLSRRFVHLRCQQRLQNSHSSMLILLPLPSPCRSASDRLTATRALSTFLPPRLPISPASLRTCLRQLPVAIWPSTYPTSLPSSCALFFLPRRHASIHVTDTSPSEFSFEFEHLSDTIQHAIDGAAADESDIDLSYSNGVLSIRTPTHGTYVINQHNVTRQVWLSSPISGPSKYNWHRQRRAVGREGRERQGQWCNERDESKDLMGLLEREFTVVFEQDVKFAEPF